MTARQQIARILPLVLVVVLVLAGLRGAVPAPRWDGPLRGDGAVVGIALEVVFGVALVLVRMREARARRASQQGTAPAAGDEGLQPPQALRFTLSNVLGAAMFAVAIALLANLHLHFLAKPHPARLSLPKAKVTMPAPAHHAGGSGGLHFDLGPVLYGLLILVIIAAAVLSIWWTARRRPATLPPAIVDMTGDELREAVAEGRAALAAVGDARAAIIACYVAMEASLAERGTARGAADTPDELLSRAVATGTVRGAAAGRLTTLFYEARFSSHPLGAAQREAASAALDDLAAELASGAEPGPPPASGAASASEEGS